MQKASTETNSEVLSAGSEVYANETVRTGNLGRADLVLLDNTNFSVGPASEVRLDKFVYDPTGSSGKVVVQATRGAFRFVTGSQDHRAYQVGTPWGTLGVRGTVVEGKVLPAVSKGMLPADECVVKLNLPSGQASFTTLTGNVYPLVAGQTLCILQNGKARYLPLETVFETTAVVPLRSAGCLLVSLHLLILPAPAKARVFAHRRMNPTDADAVRRRQATRRRVSASVWTAGVSKNLACAEAPWAGTGRSHV